MGIRNTTKMEDSETAITQRANPDGTTTV